MVEVACAVPYREVSGEVQILLVSTRKKGKWIFPKGRIQNGEQPSVTAGKEAWEEGGVRGKVHQTPLAQFSRRTETGPEPIEVFLLRVEKVKRSWPEKKVRRRKWVTLGRASKFIKKGDLKKLLPRIEATLQATAALSEI